MSLELGLFLFFAFVAILSGFLTITRSNPVIAALFLILNFGALSGLYLLLSAQFIAVVQVIVYAGAIMVLFLFVVMLLRPANEKKFFEENKRMKIFAISTGILLFIQFAITILAGRSSLAVDRDYKLSESTGTIENIGNKLYTTHLLPFEAIAFVLLVSIIGALILAKRKID